MGERLAHVGVKSATIGLWEIGDEVLDPALATPVCIVLGLEPRDLEVYIIDLDAGGRLADSTLLARRTSTTVTERGEPEILERRERPSWR